jgi:hypothetical protein
VGPERGDVRDVAGDGQDRGDRYGVDGGPAGSTIGIGGGVRYRHNDGELLRLGGGADRTALKHTGWDVEEDGLFGAPPSV